MINKKRMVEEFCQLVRVNSETRNEREIADILKEKLEKLGLEVFEDDAGEIINGNAGNIIGSLAGRKAGIKVLFNAHMDTVKPGQGVIPIIEDHVIKSQGETILGSDDKAGIVAILEMLRVLQETDVSHIPIQVIFTVAEEGGLFGAKALNPKHIKSDIAYILDSCGSAGHIVIEGPAQKNIKATVYGKAAHAGMAPEDGINAIQIAARGIARMNIGRIDKETTANIGIINGGVATNIVPDKVVLNGEARSLDTNKLSKQIEHMIHCLERGAEELGGKVETKVELVYPQINLDSKDQVVSIAIESASNLGFPVVLDKTGGGSDANVFNGNGLPTANLGCGMEKVHTTEESITIDNLVKNAEYLIEIVKVASEKSC